MAAYNLAPVAAILLVGAVLALVPVVSVWRRRDLAPGARVGALAAVTLFLAFDLVLLGAYTRLSDSGLGCPDWPGCYGHASPLGAHGAIDAAASALPSGPVTRSKAWIEMAHRYMATGVGALILLLAAFAWRDARRRADAPSPWWATLTLAWVCLQGAFGAWTVTMKLYPLVVTAHLLGAMVLLGLLAAQRERAEPAPLALPAGLRAAVWIVGALVVAQAALGGWVSANYAVLACSEFPRCQGAWWPPMDFDAGFALRRELGRSAAGDVLPFDALTAIHMAHRVGAFVVLPALGLLAWRLAALGNPARRWAVALAAGAAWQLATGLANVLLGWPLAAAVSHTGGAAALVVVLAIVATRAAQAASGSRRVGTDEGGRSARWAASGAS